jgi:DNA-binding NarL/FixJ family response regulator
VQMYSKAGVAGPYRFRARVVIADDHQLVAQACQRLLEPEFAVVGIVSDGLELMQAIEKLKPNVAVLDIGMPNLNGLDAGEEIKRKNPDVKLIYLTMLDRPDVAAEAFRRGASGYVLKQCSADELGIALRRVVQGEAYLSPLITKDTMALLLQTAASRSQEKEISGRQKEILQLLAEGKSMKEIAYILQITNGTVAFHKYKMMHTLGVKTTAGLIEYAVKNHMSYGDSYQTAVPKVQSKLSRSRIEASARR